MTLRCLPAITVLLALLTSCGPSLSVSVLSKNENKVVAAGSKVYDKYLKSEYVPVEHDSVAYYMQYLFVYLPGKDTAYLREKSALFFTKMKKTMNIKNNPFIPYVIVPGSDSTGDILFPNYHKDTTLTRVRVVCKYNLIKGLIDLRENEPAPPKFKPAQF